MEILKAITDEEKVMIENWITYHADGNSEVTVKGEQRCSVDYLLRYWANAKSDFFKMFGEKLILEEKISYTEDRTVLAEKIYRELDNYKTPIGNFKYNFYEILGKTSNPSMNEARYNFVDMFNCATLVENVYNGLPFILEHAGQTLKIETGCKPVKMLGKIAKMFDIEGFEEFRIAHSQLLNTAKITGTLCLSIHPLDFMTLSDNTSDWTSCMNWSDGCHRQGTVEMMNSPNVIVAYIKSSKSMHMPGGGEWSNKKWRELFIVDGDIITEIKPYPYINTAVTKIILDKLKNMVENPNTYDDNIHKHFGSISTDDGFTKNISFECYYMYNDFGALDDGHMSYINKNIIGKSKEDLTYWEVLSYSGYSQCVWCGENIDEGDYDEGYEGALVCHKCIEGHFCSECGNWTDVIYYLDGDDDHGYCPCCWHENTSEDPLDHERYINDVFETVYIVPDTIREGDTLLHDWYPYYWVFETVHADNIENFNIINEDAKPFTIEVETQHYSYWNSAPAKYSYKEGLAIRVSDLTHEALHSLIYETSDSVNHILNRFYQKLHSGEISTKRGDPPVEEKTVVDYSEWASVKEVINECSHNEVPYVTVDTISNLVNKLRDSLVNFHIG